MKTYKLLTACSLLFLTACGDDTSSANSVDPEIESSSSWTSSSSVDAKSSSSAIVESSSSVDAKSSSSAIEESSSSIKSESSSSVEDVSSSSEVVSSSSEILTDPLKIFKTRTPKADAYECESSTLTWTQTFSQQDWICSFKYNGDEGFVYVQSTPTSCVVRLGMIPIMSVDTAAFYVNGKYETLSDVTYDWGGNHHNDSFRFSYNGKVFEYSHSSYGWGGRSCQEMDCLKVYEADGKTLIEDGCGLSNDILSQSRTLPVVCRFANVENGSFDDFTDTFELCVGDHRIQDPAE